MTTHYKIPVHNLDALKARVAKLNEKANKLTAEFVKLTVIDTVVEDNEKFALVELFGAVPRVNGWIPVANIEYIETGTITKAYNGFEVPERYINAKPYCEHCNTHKVKKFTTLIKNAETGEIMNVGRTCLTDFVGTRIADVVAPYTAMVELINELDDEEGAYYGGAGELYYPVEGVLAYAHMVIDEYGYVRAGEDNATTTITKMIMFAPAADRALPTAVNYEFARNVIEYINGVDEDTAFMTNVKNLVEAGDITARNFGLLIGACAGYLRHVADKAANAARLDEYFGVIKKRYPMDLTLTMRTAVEGYYGTTYVHGFRDDAGHEFTWFGNRALRNLDGEKVEIGDRLKVKGTIKAHEVYKGLKKTMLNRVAAV